ncbi:hypothetical protein ACMFMG_009200 [Clarireedia jacksonii]
MQFTTLLPATLLLSLAAAQTTSAVVAPGTSVCPGQNVLDACLLSTRAIANACQNNDYNCLCPRWNDVLTCFASCPNDPQYAGVLSNKQTYCANASIYSSSSSSAISKDWPTSTTTTAGGASATDSGAAATKTTGNGSKSGTASATGSAASATGSSGAEKKVVGAGGVFGLVAGVVAWLL